MNYKNYLYILFLIFFTNCSYDTLNNKKIPAKLDKTFSNKGFALVYTDDLFKKKIISKKIDSRSLIIFQKNLKKNTTVKITNITNGKYLIAKVGNDTLYPDFNNSVISHRIFEELQLTIDEPYVEILSAPDKALFVAKRAKIYEEEKKVANKAPVESIIINDINQNETKVKKIRKKNFSYKIKLADFYFDTSAYLLVKRIEKETSAKNAKVKKLSKTKYRVYLGPFNNLNSLQNSFNDISILEFENIEIIKND